MFHIVITIKLCNFLMRFSYSQFLSKGWFLISVFKIRTSMKAMMVMHRVWERNSARTSSAIFSSSFSLYNKRGIRVESEEFHSQTLCCTNDLRHDLRHETKYLSPSFWHFTHRTLFIKCPLCCHMYLGYFLGGNYLYIGKNQYLKPIHKSNPVFT